MGPMRRLFKHTLAVDGAIRALHEVARHIDAGKIQAVMLAESRNKPTYKKIGPAPGTPSSLCC